MEMTQFLLGALLFFCLGNFVISLLILYNMRTPGYDKAGAYQRGQTQALTAASSLPLSAPPPPQPAPERRKPIVMDDEKAYYLERQERDRRRPFE